jgi:hypothetical protein
VSVVCVLFVGAQLPLPTLSCFRLWLAATSTVGVWQMLTTLQARRPALAHTLVDTARGRSRTVYTRCTGRPSGLISGWSTSLAVEMAERDEELRLALAAFPRSGSPSSRPV